MSKEEIVNYVNPFEVIANLSSYERLIYGTFIVLKRKSEPTNIENIHYTSILYAEKNHTTIKEGETLKKVLKKLATFDESTQTWNLKSNAEILQALKAKHKTKRQKNLK